MLKLDVPLFPSRFTQSNCEQRYIWNEMLKKTRCWWDSVKNTPVPSLSSSQMDIWRVESQEEDRRPEIASWNSLKHPGKETCLRLLLIPLLPWMCVCMYVCVCVCVCGHVRVYRNRCVCLCVFTLSHNLLSFHVFLLPPPLWFDLNKSHPVKLKCQGENPKCV